MKSMSFCTAVILSLLTAPLSALDIGLTFRDANTVTLTGDVAAENIAVDVSATNKEGGAIPGKSLIERKAGGVGVNSPLLEETDNSGISKSSCTMTFTVPIPEGQTLTFTHILPKVGPMNSVGQSQNVNKRTFYTDIRLIGKGKGRNGITAQAVSEPLNYSNINTHEVFFGRPVTVTGPFKVSVTLRKKAQGANTQCYAGLSGLVFRHGVVYDEQKTVRFYDRKEAVGDASPATVSLTDGWKLKSLTMTQAGNAPAPAAQWVPTWDPENPDFYFAPNTNIGNGGSWTAEFEASGDGVLTDGLILSVVRLGSGGTSQGAGRRGMKLNISADGEPLLNNFTEADTKDFDVPVRFRQLRRVKVLKIECLQNPSSKAGCYIGLKRFSYRPYTEFSERTEASADGKTPASIAMNNGWKLTSWSMTSPADKTKKWLDTAVTAGFAPNTNVGTGGSWTATFELPEAVVTDSLSLRFLRLNSLGETQAGGHMLLTAKLSDGTNETVLCDKKPLKIDKSATIRLFHMPAKGKTLTLVCEQNPNIQPEVGAFFALEAIHPWAYDHASGLAEGMLPETADAVRTVLVNPTAWPVGEVGSVVLTDGNRLPAVLQAKQDPLKTLVLRTYAAYRDPIAVPADAEPRVFLDAAVYIGGGFFPAASKVFRPGDAEMSVPKTDMSAGGLRLSVVRAGFVTNPAEAVLYAKSGETADAAEAQWWHSETVGAAAEQGALPEGTVGKIWLEGGRAKLADRTMELRFHQQTTGGTVEIPKGRRAWFAAAAETGESDLSLPKGVSLELGGSLTMGGTLPSLKVISATADLRTETGLRVNKVTADEGANLAIGGGIVTLQAPELPLTLNGGSLAVTSEPQAAVTVPSLTVDRAGSLQISAESLTLTDLAVNADLTLAGNPLTVTRPVTGTGRLLLPKETDVTEQGTTVLTGTPADGATVSAGADGRKDLWFAVCDGKIVLYKIGGSKPSESGNAILDAAYEKLYADAVKAGLPEGTKQLVYVSKGTAADAAPDTNADVAALAASLFGLTPTVAGSADENGTASVTVAYDFGITDMKATATADGTLAVTVDVSVRKPGADGPVPADYADNCGLRLRLTDGTEISGVKEADDPSLPAGTRRLTVNLPAGVTLFRTEAFAKKVHDETVPGTYKLH